MQDKIREQLEEDYFYLTIKQVNRAAWFLENYSDEEPKIILDLFTDVLFLEYSFITIGIEKDGYAHS